MASLEHAKRMAQQAADREGKAHCVMNLNRYSPLYVVREHLPTRPMTDAIVFIATPADKAPLDDII